MQKGRMKANQAAAILDALAPFILDQLDYQSAIQRGLPIGSGAIERAHRYLIQERLKFPGAWWSPDHIEAMLALRLNRANREKEAYWRGVEKEAA